MLMLGVWLRVTQPAAAVTAQVSGIDAGIGQLYVALHNKSNFLTTTYSATRVAAIGQQASMQVTLPDVPAGDYVLVVYQDKNRNGRLDKNMFGAPSEPFGFSQNVKVRFSAPGFDEAKFRHGAAPSVLSIALQRW
jgi:uncharacterized protein (DUF2141 family)